MSSTLLSRIRSMLAIDIDSMDPDVASRHTLSEKFCDMTSNQAIVYNQAIRPENATLVKAALTHARTHTKSDPKSLEFSQDVLDVLTVLLAKQVYPYLQGKVHAQTSPSVAYDVEKTVAHATRLVELFEAHGIPKDRVCIKIPATPESLIACQTLAKSNINTLATCVFSVAQSQAAVQATCAYVAPYFNELRVHFEPSLWKEYRDTAAEHPMSPIIQSIVAALKGSQTLVMPASIVTVAEVLALVSIRPDHLTLSPAILDQLAALPASTEIPVISNNTNIPENKDYLSDGAVLLKEAFMATPEISRKVVDALSIFDSCEQKTKEFLQKEISTALNEA